MYSQEKEFAIDIAKETGKLLMANYNKIQHMEWRLKTNFKIGIDDECDALIRKAIVSNFPSDTIWSEEADKREAGSERRWIVDPLDGTLSYAFDVTELFAVSIGLVKDIIPVLGVIHMPKRKELFVAVDGQGSYCDERPIRVSVVNEINKSLLALDYGKLHRQDIIEYQEKLLSSDGVCYPFTFASSAASLALVAQGKLQGYLSLDVEPWDVAAGVVIVREAGGMITNINGQNWQLGDETILAANPILHQKLLNFLTK